MGGEVKLTVIGSADGVCVCSGLRNSIACPNYEVVRVIQPGLQTRTVAKLSLDSG